MDDSAPISRSLVGWSVFLAVVLIGGGVFVVIQRDRTAGPRKGETTSDESSIPHVTLEELESDYHRPARERRYRGQLVEVVGSVVQVTQTESLGERGKPTLMVYLAPSVKLPALVCCTMENTSTTIRVGERVVLQGKVDGLVQEGLNQAGLIEARLLRRIAR